MGKRCTLLVMLLAGCSVVRPEDTVQMLGWLGSSGLPPEVAIPDTFDLGVATPIEVSTFGSSSCTRVARTEVAISGLTATVEPIDEYRTKGACTDDLRKFTHTAQLRFNAAGQADIRIHGRVGHLERDTVIVRTAIVR